MPSKRGREPLADPSGNSAVLPLLNLLFNSLHRCESNVSGCMFPEISVAMLVFLNTPMQVFSVSTPCAQLSIVVIVPSESTVVFSRFHTFQLPLCCTVTDKAAAAGLAPVDRLKRSHTFMVAELFAYPQKIPSCALPCPRNRLISVWELLKVSLENYRTQ